MDHLSIILNKETILSLNISLNVITEETRLYWWSWFLKDTFPQNDFSPFSFLLVIIQLIPAIFSEPTQCLKMKCINYFEISDMW